MEDTSQWCPSVLEISQIKSLYLGDVVYQKIYTKNTDRFLNEPKSETDLVK